jgi:DNA-binding NarL/FixJ family response regulator
VKKRTVSEPAQFARQNGVVLCGDMFLHRKLFSDSVSMAAGLTLIRCSEDWEAAFRLCNQLDVSLFVARQAFIEQLPATNFLQLTKYGKGSSVLAVLESDTIEMASASKLLRLGCRGVLTHPFSSKLFRRAVLAILKGELWAPRGLISELLSDLLRADSLKTENGLTPQEARILDLTRQGFKNSAIADALFISQETVRWHKRRLNRKLRGTTRYPQANATLPIREIAAS